MENKELKVESLEEFLARGGKIIKLPSKKQKAMKVRKEFEEEEVTAMEPVDFSVLPTALKIRYGIKE